MDGIIRVDEFARQRPENYFTASKIFSGISVSASGGRKKQVDQGTGKNSLG